MRLILADHDITMGPGEVAEFDTRLPHSFGPADNRPVEILSLLGKQGERIHVRAAPRPKVNTSQYRNTAGPLVGRHVPLSVIGSGR
jgi:hypothetical protein